MVSSFNGVQVMTHHMRIDALRSAIEAAGVAMAPSDEEYGVSSDNAVADTADPTPKEQPAIVSWSSSAQTSVRQWLTLHWPNGLST
jgi:hypothetical protein